MPSTARCICQQLQPQEIDAVKAVAKLKGIDSADLIREWVLEKVKTA